MSTMKIKTGDTVKVIAGKDKDKEGKVIAVNKKDGRVLVEGVNMLTKHTKPSAANQNGGIVHQEAYSCCLTFVHKHYVRCIDITFLMYDATVLVCCARLCVLCQHIDAFKIDGDKKVRFAKKTGEVID